MSGYLDRAYACSLEEWGEPIFLPRSEGWLLKRQIPGEEAFDAIGPYPFLCCRNWAGLAEDIAELDGLTSVTVVTDPFGDHDENVLRQAFSDRCERFKDHYVVDLAVAAGEATSPHHRRNASTALRQMDVTAAHEPASMIDTWCDLYGHLVKRHDVAGPQAFSRSIFERQLAVPGIQALVAERDGEPIGMTLWYEQDDAAYYHLGAYSPVGYDLNASFAIFSYASDFFRQRVRWLALGAGPGLQDEESGLARFKRGWATGVRPTYLCGAILDMSQYGRLSARRPPTYYFPAYRAQEFA